jgi:hypothetical protein
VTLLSLEVSTSGEERREAAARNGDGPDGDGPLGSHAGRRAATAGDEPEDLSLEPIREGVIELPDGVLVDVLA